MLKCQCKKIVSLKHGVTKGDKSNIENGTDHFCEDTRQNALAALTNLGHMTPFFTLGPIII